MVVRFSKLASLGVLFSLLDISQSSPRSPLREAAENAAKMTGEKQYVSMEDITKEMRELYGPELFDGDQAGGLRKLEQCQPWTCEKGSNPDLVMTFAGRNWGSCVDIDPCLCGLMPLQMAYWCPKECRIDCGGTCATPEVCPDGYAIEDGQIVVLEYPLPPPPWDEWICGLGTACPTPMPTPAPSVPALSDATASSPAPSLKTDTKGIPGIFPPTSADTSAPSVNLPPIWYWGGGNP